MYENIAAYMKNAFNEYWKVEDLLSLGSLSKVFVETMIVFLKMVAPVFGIAVITALLAGYSQVGFLFTTETLGMKFSRISPLNGFKRIFSSRALVELLKALLKVTIVSLVAFSYIKGEVLNIMNLMHLELRSAAVYIATVSLNMAIRVCVALIIIGVLDYIYQWWEYEKSLRMTKQEVKEEYKQLEGNPEIKSKIKQKQRQISMRRMLQDVPKADVVITNPTHFAVAVKYDAKLSDAPVVVAKGQDFIAQRIKEVAKESNVEIVENRPLARSLYETVEIGAAIPPELYQAVAEVLAFVYSLKEKNTRGH